MCSSLQQILENDPLIPRPVIHTVDVTDRSKRIELVENAVETAGQWIEANQEKDPNLDKSNSDLEDLCHGMEQVPQDRLYCYNLAIGKWQCSNSIDHFTFIKVSKTRFR